VKIVDDKGNYALSEGTLLPLTSDNPVYKARIALALPVGKWLYAPAVGHTLDVYRTRKASSATVEEFQKTLKFYLQPYGPVVTNTFVTRGTLKQSINITKETLNG
jgi:hypothetical protein